MNMEEFSTPEKEKEHIPSMEEVLIVFKELFEDVEFKEIKKREDSKGLYWWNIEIVSGDGTTEYLYIRKGVYSEGEALLNVVNVAYFDREGIPTGGHSVAKYMDNAWKLTP
jgi:hypothetical protein